jgi:lipopolysaccharide/colanic/teichoic acid biosynthesis glycosyltransferase
LLVLELSYLSQPKAVSPSRFGLGEGQKRSPCMSDSLGVHAIRSIALRPETHREGESMLRVAQEEQAFSREHVYRDPIPKAAVWRHAPPAVSPVSFRRSVGDVPWSLSRTKRILDVLVSVAVLILAFVPGILVYLAIRLTSPGPGLFRQERVGYRGGLFTLFKFRTMESAPACQGPGLTRDGDPRITPIGKLLRRLKLDEVPQFYNVLRGEMSLVGPRPKLPQYSAPTDALFRPGISGFSTLVFRGEEKLLQFVSPEDLDRFYESRIRPLKARADLHYMRKATLFSDVRILFLTVFVSLFPSARHIRRHEGVRTFALARSRQVSRRPELNIEFE